MTNPIRRCLASFPGLPPFAAAAIERELAARIRQWQALTKAAVMATPDLPDIFLATDDGFDHLMALIGRFGGCAVYIPHVAPDNHPLIAAIGRPAVTWLCRELGGSQICVPKLDSVLTAVRDQAIRADHRAGMTIHQITERHCISRSAVYRVLGVPRDTSTKRKKHATLKA